jgi:hypothetical protein
MADGLDRSAATTEPVVLEYNLLRPGSVLIERYAPEKGKPQWCVHKVESDGSLSQLIVLGTRREALEWAASHV